jgi:hypothetical protein
MVLPGLSFSPALGVQAAIRHLNFFPIKGLKEFYLVISIGRCKFQLSEENVCLILQASLDFGVQTLSP